MFPYRVDNPRLSPAIGTGMIVAANLLAWVALEGAGSELPLAQALCGFGLIPARLMGQLPTGSTVALGEDLSCTVGSASPWLTPLSSMFMHGGWFHLVSNMWFLWLFGRNVEDVMGIARYALFYLLAGLAAAAAEVLADPGSRLPMVGASGAISGIMGAYIVLFPKVRVHVWVFLAIFATRVDVPAFLMLGYWFGLQLLGANVTAISSQGGDVAFAAHVGGFIAGALLVMLFRDPGLMAQREALLASQKY